MPSVHFTDGQKQINQTICNLAIRKENLFFTLNFPATFLKKFDFSK